MDIGRSLRVWTKFQPCMGRVMKERVLFSPLSSMEVFANSTISSTKGFVVALSLKFAFLPSLEISRELWNISQINKENQKIKTCNQLDLGTTIILIDYAQKSPRTPGLMYFVSILMG